MDLWECRYLDPKELDMNIEIVVYNNTVVMYQFKSKEIFCVEISNEDLAKTMKNLFDFVWLRARKMKKTDARGSVKL